LTTTDYIIQAGEQQAPALAAALGALVAANAPALRDLNVWSNGLRDAGLGPLVDASRRSTRRHLRKLNLSENSCTAAFARDRLLPAVRSETSLRRLRAENYVAGGDADEFTHEAEALVAARNAAAAP
jgi:hypothetical protein